MIRINIRRYGKRITALCAAALLTGTLFILPENVHAIKTMQPVVSEFGEETETVYTTSRARAITAGELQWKLTDSGKSVRNQDGLTVTKGFLSLAKDNPAYDTDSFSLEVEYSTQYEDASADPAAAFLFTSDAVYNTNMLFNDTASTLGIAENGDVYYKGQKINHSGKADQKDILNAKNPDIAPGDVCRLSVQYTGGALTVTLAYGGTERVLADGYVCELSGLRQLQIGADRTAASRQANVTYRKISFSVPGDYVPAENAAAVLEAEGVITEYTNPDQALNAALDAAAGGKKTLLELHADFILKNPVTVKAGMDLTIDLNGFSIDRNARSVKKKNGCVFLLEEGAALTVIDSAPDRVHADTAVRGGIIRGGAGSSVGGGFQLLADTSLSMTGGTVMSCVTDDHGGAIRVKGKNVHVVLKNVHFSHNFTVDSTDNCHGGAIYGTENCEISMTGCSFDGNYSEDCGGAVYMNEGTLKAENCSFYGNSCLDDGGAVYLEDGTYALLDHCRYFENHADGNGGAVYCNSENGTRMSGTFLSNNSLKNGGAVYVNDDSVCIMDSELTNNRANGNGGAVFVDDLNDLNVQGKLVIRNNFGGKGKDDIFLDDSLFAEAHIYDGGLYEGSELYIRTDDSSHTVLKEVSAFQLRYFRCDETGRKMVYDTEEGKIEEQKLTTSAIGTGSVLFVSASAAAALIAVVIMILVQKKKQKGAADK